MRHKVYGKHLGRNKNERTGLFRSLVGSLILNGEIVTTESKAKAIKGLVDKIISQAKVKNTQRLVASFLTQKSVQEKLFNEVVPAVSKRTSGFTSVVKLGRRPGDAAMKVRMSLLTEKVTEVSEVEAKPAISTKMSKVSKVEKTIEKPEIATPSARNDKSKPTRKVSKK